MLDILLEEEPGLLPRCGLGERIGVPHSRQPDLAVRDTADKLFDTSLSSRAALEDSSIIVEGRARDQIPIPSGGDVFVFSAG